MKPLRSTIHAVMLFFVAASVAFAGEQSKSQGKPSRTFRAGAAVSNITPPLGLPIVGGWSPKPATHIHDELYAKCLVLDNGETRLAFVIADNISMPRDVADEARKAIQEKTGILPSNVILAGTHTHSSVSMRAKMPISGKETPVSYSQFLVMRIADGLCRAINNLQPARIGWGSAQAPTQVFNRRYYMKPGTPTPNPFGGEDKAVMNPGRGNPNILKAAGPTDPEVAFLSVQSKEGRPIALLANYSLHYVGPHAGQVISADYFGVFADRIQQLLGADRLDPPFVGILCNGTSADINNVNWPQKPEKRWGPYEKMRQVADLVAQAVYQAHQSVEFHDWVKLAAAYDELTLAARKPTEKQLAYARQVLAKPKDAKPYHRHEQTYARRVLSLDKSPDEVNVALQAFRIGDVGICTIPFEVFVEIGLELKAKSPFERTFTISHANGGNGYLPTVEQHALGGYETWLGTNRIEIQAAPKIVDRLLAMIRSLQ